MDNSPTNIKKVNSNRLTINYKFTKKFNICCSDNRDKSNEKSNYDQNSVNLFQGIVKLGTIKSTKENNIPFSKSKSINNSQNIFEFTESIYNDEEHFYKNQILSCKNSENDSPHNNIHSPRWSKKLEKARSSRDIFGVSKDKNNSSCRKLMNKKNSGGLFRMSLKSKSKRYSMIKLKSGEINNNHKSNNNFSFFFKLKEKDKIPSKTPYLDKKHWNSTYSLNKFELNNKVNNVVPFKKKNSSNCSLVRQSVLSKEKIDEEKRDYTDIFVEKNDSLKLPNNANNVNLSDNKKKEENNTNVKNEVFIYKEDSKKNDNNDINKEHEHQNKNDNDYNIKKSDNTNNIIVKKETIKTDINNNLNNIISKENNILIQNKNNNKNKSNIVFNILNKPFFCCLKS